MQFLAMLVDDIVQKMEKIIEIGKDGREKTGRANRQKILEHYTISKHLEQLKETYERAL